MIRRSAVSVRGLAVLLALVLGAGLVLASPPQPAEALPTSFNPFAMSGGFTVYGREDVTLGNHELEGSVAAGEVLRRDGSGQYAVVHVVAGTGVYTLPTVDGDPTRVLAGRYDTASSGILAITSAGTSEPDLQGALKLVERDGPFQAFARGGWVRLGTNPANPDQEPLIDATHQSYPDDAQPPVGSVGGGSIYTADTGATAVADYVEANQQATWEEAQQCLAAVADPSSAIAAHIGIAEHAGDRVVLEPLSGDQPNVVDYSDIAGAGRLQFSDGPRPGAQNPLIIRVPAGTTSVGGVQIDPEHTYAPFVMWDLSAVTGSVAVSATGGGRMDGSIYAPEADVTVTAQPLEGQVIGRDVTILGGEVHSFLFQGDVTCQGQFRVQKVLDGVTADDLPEGFTFTVNYTATPPGGEPSTGTMELPADGTWVYPDEVYPVGTVIAFEEIPAASVPGYEWATPVISPATVTITEDGAAADVTVTNAATQLLGSFTVSKVVTDGDPTTSPDPVPDGSVPVTWTATLAGEPVADGTLDVPFDGTPVGPTEQLPLGTEVVLEEDIGGIEPPDGFTWGAAAWNPSQPVTIGSTAGVAVTLTNVLVPEGPERHITIVKVADGDPGLASDAYEFAVGHNTNAENTERTRVPIAVGDPVTLLQFPADADTLFLSEQLPLLNGVPVDPADWEDPVFRVGDTVYEPGGFGENEPTAAIPVDGDSDVVVEVHNARRFGTFELSKELVGLEPDSLPDGTEFTVRWHAELPEGTVLNGVVRLPADGTPVTPLDHDGEPLELPFGTVVDLTEFPGPALRQTPWEPPVFTPEQLVIGADGAATVSATVTNTAAQALGTFSVVKSFDGIDPGPVSAETVRVLYVVRTPFPALLVGGLDVPLDGTPALPLGPDGEVLRWPVGSQVWFLEEPMPADALPPGYDWAVGTWTSTSLEIEEDGQVVEMDLTNSVVQLAQVSVAKLVEGADVPDDTEFSVAWWLDGEPQEPMTVTAGETVTTPPVPVGSIIEVAEPTLPDVDDVEWDDPVWVGPDGPLEPESNGRYIVPFDVGPDATVALQLVNTADVPEEPTTPPNPTTPPEPTSPGPTTPGPDVPGLPGTGVSGLGWLIALGVALVAAGALIVRRSRANR